MSICANRTETGPGFFTSCEAALDGSPCACGVEVRAEVAAQSTPQTPQDRPSAPRRVEVGNYTAVIPQGRQIEEMGIA